METALTPTMSATKPGDGADGDYDHTIILGDDCDDVEDDDSYDNMITDVWNKWKCII